MMSEHITRKQLLEGRIRQIKSILNGQYGKLGGSLGASKLRKRKLTPKRTAELYSKLAAYQRELNAL